MRKKLILFFLISFLFSYICSASSLYLNVVWSVDYNGGYDDWASSVRTDSMGNVIVTGVSYDPITFRGNYLTIKYNSNGDLLWSKIYNSGNNDTGRGLSIDSQDNIIVTGQSGSRYHTIKYDSDGTPLWGNGISGPFGNSFDVDIDSQDNVIVVGTSGGNYYIIKYCANGTKLWEKSYNAGGFDTAHGVAVDAKDNIIVTGTSSKGGFTRNYHTVKFDSNGTLVWPGIEYGGAGWDEAWGVTIDFQDNIIVTGRSQTNHPVNFDQHYHTIKYDPEGNEFWEKGITGPKGVAWGITNDSKDNIIVTGGVILNGRTFYTIIYNPEGEVIWSDAHLVGGLGEPWCVAIDSNDDIIVTGTSRIEGRDNYYTIKYSQFPLPHNNVPIAVDDHYSISQGLTLDILAPGVISNDLNPKNTSLEAIKVNEPKNGILIFNSDGSFTYSPNPNFCGFDSFTYKLNDGIDNSNEATVSIEVLCSTTINRNNILPEIVLNRGINLQRLIVPIGPVPIDGSVGSIIETGEIIVIDEKDVSSIELSYGKKSILAQVKNIGFFTQNEAILKFDNLPQGISIDVEPQSQKIKANSIGNYLLSIEVSPEIEKGQYYIAVIAYTKRGTLDSNNIKLVIK